MNISNYLAARWLNMAFRGEEFDFPDTVYLALYTSDPTAADTGAEVNGGSYTRQIITLSVPAIENVQMFHPVTGVQVTAPMMTIKNDADIVLPIATADWGNVAHLGIRDGLVAGNLLYYGAWENARTILAGDRPRIMMNSLALRLG